MRAVKTPRIISCSGGNPGEDLAASWYEAHGYEVVARNWRCPQGELDIVFRRRGQAGRPCEVKARTSNGVRPARRGSGAGQAGQAQATGCPVVCRRGSLRMLLACVEHAVGAVENGSSREGVAAPCASTRPSVMGGENGNSSKVLS